MGSTRWRRRRVGQAKRSPTGDDSSGVVGRRFACPIYEGGFVKPSFSVQALRWAFLRGVLRSVVRWIVFRMPVGEPLQPSIRDRFNSGNVPMKKVCEGRRHSAYRRLTGIGHRQGKARGRPVVGVLTHHSISSEVSVETARAVGSAKSAPNAEIHRRRGLTFPVLCA